MIKTFILVIMIFSVSCSQLFAAESKKGETMGNQKETVLDVLKEVRDLLRGKDAVVSPAQVIKPRVINDRFTDNGDGTITDKQQKLVWIKDPSSIPELKNTMTYSEAESACAKLSFAGFNSGWRMPTLQEEQSIRDYTKYEPAWDKDVFGGKYDNWYWTSTPCAWSTGSAWCVTSGNGSVGSGFRGSNSYVRPVRSSQ